jgi:hypothetical protein
MRSRSVCVSSAELSVQVARMDDMVMLSEVCARAERSV